MRFKAGLAASRSQSGEKPRHCLPSRLIASREGGASLNILAGLVAGNFSAFWMGLTIVGLMGVAAWIATMGLGVLMLAPAIFAFGLVAFGFLGMGPVTIAVDSYGPVTDNAQSVYELSQIEAIPGIEAELQKDFGFKPQFEKGKDFLEANDGAGNTFKATAKPVLIGTAVIYWFTGASIQAVSTGAYRAVEFIKKNIKLDAGAGRASVAIFGLYQAIFMANAGGAWDNAKKIVEVELKEKGTPLHGATVVGDTVGDPFKDTSSVAMHPVIKFTTLFGLLAVELAVEMTAAGQHTLTQFLAAGFLAVALFFVDRSFYGMRIHSGNEAASH
jgi:K(+)-stimulated pyrophosphate-energized sodium pump